MLPEILCQRGPRRGQFLATALCGLLSCLMAGQAFAQQAKGNKKPRPEEVTRVTKTGIPLKMTYFPSDAKEDAPVAVLLHGQAGNRLIWNKFALRLQQETKFAVITVDLSNHGESGSRSLKGGAGNKKSDTASLKVTDYKLMVMDDLETVKDFIFELHQKKELNMTKLALVGADFSAGIAVAYAEYDWNKSRYDDAPVFEQRTPRGEDVRGLVLLSPDESVPGFRILQSAHRLKSLPMPVMIAVSKDDSYDKGAAKALHDQFAPRVRGESTKPYVFLQMYGGKARGTDLLNKDNQRVENDIILFLENHVGNFDAPWRDRRSATERDVDEPGGR